MEILRTVKLSLDVVLGERLHVHALPADVVTAYRGFPDLQLAEELGVHHARFRRYGDHPGLGKRLSDDAGAEDGLGWWIDYLCRLMANFPQMSRDYVLYELAGCEGWAFYAGSVESDAWRDSERKSKGYIRQEIERRLKKKLKR